MPTVGPPWFCSLLRAWRPHADLAPLYRLPHIRQSDRKCCDWDHLEWRGHGPAVTPGGFRAARGGETVRLRLFLAIVILSTALAVDAGLAQSGDCYDLGTWGIVGSAPDGQPIVSSQSFTLRGRIVGGYAGSSGSLSFGLWGCVGSTPADDVVYAAEIDPEVVTVRWTLTSLSDIQGLVLYRASLEGEPFARLHEGLLPPESPGSYCDTSVWPQGRFCYELRALNSDGEERAVHARPACAETGGRLVTGLRAPFPNPFSSQTSILFDVAASARMMRLVVCDVTGRVVRTLANGPVTPGRHSLSWDGTNDAGQSVATGIYFCSLEAGGVKKTQTVVFLR